MVGCNHNFFCIEDLKEKDDSQHGEMVHLQIFLRTCFLGITFKKRLAVTL